MPAGALHCLPLSYGAASLGTWPPRPSWADLHRGILVSFLLPGLAVLHPLLSSLILTARFAHPLPLYYAEPFTQLEVPPRQELGQLEIYPTCKLTSEPPQFHGGWKRREMPGSEAKDGLRLTAAAGASYQHCHGPVPQAPNPTEGQTAPAYSAVVLQERNPDLRDPESFLGGSKHACPSLWREKGALFFQAAHLHYVE